VLCSAEEQQSAVTWLEWGEWCNRPAQRRPSGGTKKKKLLSTHFKSDVWLTVHRNSVWIRKTN